LEVYASRKGLKKKKRPWYVIIQSLHPGYAAAREEPFGYRRFWRQSSSP